MTGRIFISHATEEHDLAEHIANYIESRKEYKFKAWYAPRDVRAGIDYDREIIEAIEQCRAFVLLLSVNSDASDDVKTELYNAVENKKRVITLEVDRINPKNLKYLLGMRHRLNWLERRDETLDELIRNILDEAPEVAATKNQLEELAPEVKNPPEEVKVNASGKIFLSFPSSKRKLAGKIIERLERESLETWYPSRDVSAGMNYDEAVTSALKECRAFVLLFSKEADNSSNIQSELKFAVSEHKPIFRLKIDKSEPEKLRYFLASSPVFDTRKNYDEALNELVRALKGENKPEPSEPDKPRKFSLKKFLCLSAVFVSVIAGAFVFVHDDPKNYDVFYLAEHGTPEEIQSAINSGADFSVLSEDENEEEITPLLIAARNNRDPEAIKLLLKADNDASNYLDISPLFTAAYSNTHEVLKVFLDAEGSTRRDLILKGTIRYRPEPENYTFIKDGIKLDRQTESITLLMYSSMKLENIKYLLEIGADVNARNEEGTTALMWASGAWGLPEILKTLIDAGAEVNAQDRYGSTALMCAAYNSIYTMFSDVVSKLEVLINAGANVNLHDNDGDTALILAAQVKHMGDRAAIIKTLLNAGADINIRNKFGKTAYDYARENKNFDPSLLPLLSPDVQPKKEN